MHAYRWLLRCDWFFSSYNRISLFSWIWLEPMMSSSTTFFHKQPMLLNFWQGKVNYKYSRTSMRAMDVLYHRDNRNQGHFVFLCESQSVYMSVCISLPPLFLCLQLNLWPLFFYFYKKDLMFAMFMHKYDQGQNFKHVKSWGQWHKSKIKLIVLLCDFIISGMALWFFVQSW